MNSRLQLDEYLARARQRLQAILTAQGAAALLAALLLATLAASLLLRRYGFADSVAVGGRIVLALVAAGVGTWFFLRWRAMRRNDSADSLERALPEQSGRVATYLQERAKEPGRASILIDLLAEDAQRIAEREPIAATIPGKRIWLPAAGAAAAVVLTIATLTLNGALGEGARHLWLGKLPPATSIAAAAGGIAVQPGDATVRRNQDLAIGALVAGGGDDVQVHVRFDTDDEWEVTSMSPAAEGGYAFTLYAVRDAARYYVTSGSLKSAEHRIEVVDLPTVEKLRLSYDYPGWTGLPDRHEESGGDVRAVAGTKISIEVETSAPLEGPLLVINGSDAKLSQSGVTSRGGFNIAEAGHYRIATRFGDEIVPLTPDYLIEVVQDEKPDVRIVRPGRDYRATAIEEVPVRVQARDDFRLEELQLHYSVNGGEWQAEQLPAGSADIQAAALLRLEEMQKAGPRGESPLLVPGDLVSYYAQARDHSHSVQTDLFLIQVQPFEQRFTQSQAGGGGGGGGGGGEEDQNDISRRQRDVLLATWNLARGQEGAGERDVERAMDNARMLAEVQQTLAGQATSLVERARARQLTGQDASVNQFVKSLEDAAKAMVPAAKNLSELELQEAIRFEQQALQHLLRAESAFRDIQVAMNQQGGGGGGGGAQAGRDVSEMTELELDLEKNQYETESQMTAQQQGQAEDELLRRLRELARRQEQLAREAARQTLPPEQQRWQQEQLRREAEELRRQLEQLAQQQSQQGGQQQGGQQQSGQQQGGQQQRGQQQGGQQQGGQQRSAQQQNGSQQGGQQQSGRAQSAAEAARQVAQAMEQMNNARDRESAERASEQLNRAREQLERGRQQADRERFEGLAESAQELADLQRASERALRAAIGNRPPSSIAAPNADRESGMTFEQMDRLSSARRELQAGLDELRRRMESTQRQAAGDSPRAARQVAEAQREIEENNIAGVIGRTARDIERGRGRDAAAIDSAISDFMDRLSQRLDQAAETADAESGRRQGQQGREADAGDLLAELSQLRRALDQARAQSLQNQNAAGQPDANSPNAREGQAGQDGGQQGQQGQGQGQQPGGQGQGQQGQGQGQQRGAGTDGTGDGGIGNEGRQGGGGGSRLGGQSNARFAGGGPRDGQVGTPLSGSARDALRNQTRMSADALSRLREQLAAGGELTQADIAALSELSQRLRRGDADPMSAEYQRMTALVNQLELSALKAQQAGKDTQPTRSGETVDDSRRYRDNVAEYYRRLGGGND